MEPTEHFGIYFGYIRRLFQSWVSPFKFQAKLKISISRKVHNIFGNKCYQHIKYNILNIFLYSSAILDNVFLGGIVPLSEYLCRSRQMRLHSAYSNIPCMLYNHHLFLNSQHATHGSLIHCVFVLLFFFLSIIFLFLFLCHICLLVILSAVHYVHLFHLFTLFYFYCVLISPHSCRPVLMSEPLTPHAHFALLQHARDVFAGAETSTDGSSKGTPNEPVINAVPVIRAKSTGN